MSKAGEIKGTIRTARWGTSSGCNLNCIDCRTEELLSYGGGGQWFAENAKGGDAREVNPE